MRTSNKLTVTNLTHLGFHINAIVDSGEDLDLAYAEIHEAAELGRLLEHLANRLRGRADLYLLTSLEPEHVTAIEIALRDAAGALQGREMKKASIKNSGLSLVMAIILEALQQNFSPYPNEPEPEQELWAPEARN